VPLNSGHAYVLELSGPVVEATLLELFATRFTHSDRGTWHTRFDAGEVEITFAQLTRVAKADDAPRSGMRLTWHRPPWFEPEVPTRFDVVFEDEHLLVVSKPSGLPTAPAGGFLDQTLLSFVRATHPQAANMHRLGRGTSGLVVFALSEPARHSLPAQFRDRSMSKSYRALASGHVPQEPFDIRAPIGEVPHPRLGTLFAATDDGRSAHSHVTRLELRDDASLCDVRITTGRPHQIRIHLAFAGHPLVGDPLYTHGGRPGADLDTLPGELGYHLHAHRLRLVHPVSGTALELTAPAPPLLRSSLEAIV